ncbi:hypothetical protein DFAR_3000022 [Desulfarculales bacterium]
MRTLQQNCLVYTWLPRVSQAEIKGWLLARAKRVVERLAHCGFLQEQQGLLASSPAWCQNNS